MCIIQTLGRCCSALFKWRPLGQTNPFSHKVRVSESKPLHDSRWGLFKGPVLTGGLKNSVAPFKDGRAVVDGDVQIAGVP